LFSDDIDLIGEIIESTQGEMPRSEANVKEVS
jgi:hypothetical protein